MAKKIPVPPPSAEALQEVLRVVRAAPEPLLPKAISALLVDPHAIGEKQLIPILQAYVDSHDLHLIPGATATAKPRYWGQDLGTMCRDAIRAAIQSSSGPVTAAEIAKGLLAPVKLKEGGVEVILQEFVEREGMVVYPSDKPKGKSRYWNQDLNTIGRALVPEAMQRADGPITAKELASLLVSPIKFTEADLTSILEELSTDKILNAFAPAKATGKTRYWDRDTSDLGRQELIKLLNAKGPQNLTNLKKAAKSLSASQFEGIFQSLLDSDKLFRHPPVGSSKQDLFGVRPPVLDPYLKDLGQQLGKVVATLTAAKVSRDDLRRALVQLIESTGITFGATSSTQEAITAEASIDESASAQIATSVDLIELMKQIEPGAERGALVGARELRRVAQLEKTQFDSSVLTLARQGKLSLHRHDFAASLTQPERDELVTDGAGTYYIGVAIRQNEC